MYFEVCRLFFLLYYSTRYFFFSYFFFEWYRMLDCPRSLEESEGGREGVSGVVNPMGVVHHADGGGTTVVFTYT